MKLLNKKEFLSLPSPILFMFWEDAQEGKAVLNVKTHSTEVDYFFKQFMPFGDWLDYAAMAVKLEKGDYVDLSMLEVNKVALDTEMFLVFELPDVANMLIPMSQVFDNLRNMVAQ